MKENIERLMMEHGFTLKEINLIKSAAVRSNYDIFQEVLYLKKGFYGTALSLLVIFFVFVLSDNTHYTSLILTFFISIFLVLYFSAIKLKYKSFMFLRKHKG
ncbi:hypothetical protein PSI19_07480 [Xenorhabdus khoisanae]|uniref:hypothetical protein n=1 Tax=Xenorhabdus khoisanae TaxID=880157 RepID=UPI002358ED56|nr:hypothetical protein [Xenorhabdus khoisanae]MDC9613730.1 hypothetical protein [Xenorhabdus khoisanae]